MGNEGFLLELAFLLLAFKLIAFNGLVRLIKFTFNKEKVNFGDILKFIAHVAIILAYLYIAIPHYKNISYDGTFLSGIESSFNTLNGLH